MPYFTSVRYRSATGTSHPLPVVKVACHLLLWSCGTVYTFSRGLGTIECIGTVITMATVEMLENDTGDRYNRYHSVTLIVRAHRLDLPCSVLSCHSELSAVWMLCISGHTYSYNQYSGVIPLPICFSKPSFDTVSFSSTHTLIMHRSIMARGWIQS